MAGGAWKSSILVIALSVPSLFSQTPTAGETPSHQLLLSRYCVTCHNEKLRTADFLLDKVDIRNIPAGAPIWEKVIRKLRAGQMPPSGAPRPDIAALQGFISYMESELDQAAMVHPNPGRPASLHRMNRAEYANAIRDLLALEIDTESLLPTDDAGFGFDNNADVLAISPLLMEKYMFAAGKISSLAIGDITIRAASQTYNVSRELIQDTRISETLPFGSRGGIAVRHQFPVDGDYTLAISLLRDEQGYIKGLREPHSMDVRLDGARIKLFTVGGDFKGRSGPVFSQTVVEYRGDPEQVKYEMAGDVGLSVRFAAKAGTHQLGVTFLKRDFVREGELMPSLAIADSGRFRAGDPAIGWITVTGPYDVKGTGDTASRRRILVCQPSKPTEEDPCATQILSALARRAYRRPIDAGDLQPLLKQYQAGRAEGGFEKGIGRALQRLLAGPDFLFRMEYDPATASPDTPYEISDLELASRLSFFLWSSIPDDELLDLAERKKLRDPVVLEQQVKRMMADSRSKALVDNFAKVWLNLREMKRISPDLDGFPSFDDNLREAFQQETELLFESMLREDQSVLRLLDSDYTFVNERLARHYGIPNIYGSRFRRVALTDENRRGLLGQGSILTVTSYANRTSPVLRGKWVLEQLLGTPPPPPPPDVPALEEKSKEGKALTMRQAMEQHRANPVCASCHRLMDPIGFALENFDAIGQWRAVNTFDSGASPIDSSGTLPDGTKFQGPAELHNVLLSRPEQFVNTVTEKLLIYALGRGLEYYDGPAVRKIQRESAGKNYTWSSLILGIVKSAPFQMRRSRAS